MAGRQAARLQRLEQSIRARSPEDAIDLSPLDRDQRDRLRAILGRAETAGAVGSDAVFALLDEDERADLRQIERTLDEARQRARPN